MHFFHIFYDVDLLLMLNILCSKLGQTRVLFFHHEWTFPSCFILRRTRAKEKHTRLTQFRTQNLQHQKQTHCGYSIVNFSDITQTFALKRINHSGSSSFHTNRIPITLPSSELCIKSAGAHSS